MDKLKYIWFVFILLVLSACSQKTMTVAEGYDNTLLDTQINIATELRGSELLVRVNNPNQIYYKMYFIYKYKCKDRNGYSRTTVYKGNDLFYPVLINTPSDPMCDQSLKIELKDFNNKPLYETPLLKTLMIEERQ